MAKNMEVMVWVKTNIPIRNMPRKVLIKVLSLLILKHMKSMGKTRVAAKVFGVAQ